jgi:hypothetical protein
MDNNELSFDVLQYRLKSARRKKRLQKKDFDKQLIRMMRHKDQLLEQRRDLPMIPLEKPYQRGWKRCFALREDVARSSSSAFYEGLLAKINTVQYSPEKSFKVKKRRKGKKVRVEKRQFLMEFSEWYWNDARLKLTEVERTHFHLYEVSREKGKEKTFRYRFNEPWKYRLQVKPHLITEVKMVDEVLEQEIKFLNNHIEKHHLYPRISKLTGGAYHYWKWAGEDKACYLEAEKEALLEIKEAMEFKKEEQF